MKFKTKPYAHQQACWDRSKDLEYFGLLAEMGTGKSKMLIDTAAHLYLEGKIDGLVVLSPKSCVSDWTDNHIPTHMSGDVKFKLVEWRAAPGKQLMEDLRSIAKATPGRLDVLCMNIEGGIGALAHKVLT